MRQLITRAMGNPDQLVVVLDYRDKDGNQTRRVVSPIRFSDTDRFLALCLCREEPRQFQLDRCSNLKLAEAHNYFMPVPICVVN